MPASEDGPRQEVVGRVFWCTGGRCTDLPYRLVLREHGPGYVAIGALTFPVGQHQSVHDFYSLLMGSLFGDDLAERASGD